MDITEYYYYLKNINKIDPKFIINFYNKDYKAKNIKKSETNFRWLGYSEELIWSRKKRSKHI